MAESCEQFVEEGFDVRDDADGLPGAAVILAYACGVTADRATPARLRLSYSALLLQLLDEP